MFNIMSQIPLLWKRNKEMGKMKTTQNYNIVWGEGEADRW